jgi:proteic killer suppression protein
VIRSFATKEAEEFFRTGASKRLPSTIRRTAMRKLQYLDMAAALTDLASPPGNHLEALRGDRSGQHSIRINDKFRICFIWANDGARPVEIVDYH